MLDTKGPEIRSGFFANGAKKIELVKGNTSKLLACWIVSVMECCFTIL